MTPPSATFQIDWSINIGTIVTGSLGIAVTALTFIRRLEKKLDRLVQTSRHQEKRIVRLERRAGIEFTPTPQGDSQ